MNITKNAKKVYNFGVTSEFSKVLLKRAAEKLNPNKVDGSVSNFAKQYLQTFSNWAPSMGISDDLRKYQLPLPVGVYESVPDSAGLTRAEMENKLFDEALKNAIIEISEGITPEVKGVSTTFHFAEGKEATNEDGSFIDLGNPAHAALLTGGAASLLGYLASDKKKKKKGEALENALLSGLIGGGAGYLGSSIMSGPDKPTPTVKQSTQNDSKPVENDTVKPDVQTNVSTPSVDQGASVPLEDSASVSTTEDTPETPTGGTSQAKAVVTPQAKADTPQATKRNHNSVEKIKLPPVKQLKSHPLGGVSVEKGYRRFSRNFKSPYSINTLEDANNAAKELKELYVKGLIPHETLEKSLKAIADFRREHESLSKKKSSNDYSMLSPPVSSQQTQKVVKKQEDKRSDYIKKVEINRKNIRKIIGEFDIKTQEGRASALKVISERYPNAVNYARDFIDVSILHNIPIKN